MDKGTMERFSIRSYQETRAKIGIKVIGSDFLNRGRVIGVESVGLRPMDVDVVTVLIFD